MNLIQEIIQLSSQTLPQTILDDVAYDSGRPEKALRHAILERALFDLSLNCKHHRRSAANWFRDVTSDSEGYITYQDVIETLELSTTTVNKINALVASFASLIYGSKEKNKYMPTGKTGRKRVSGLAKRTRSILRAKESSILRKSY